MRTTIGISGLGYVGLPLFCQFSKSDNFKMVGYDKDKKKINLLQKNISYIDDIESSVLKKLNNVTYSDSINVLKDVDYIIICLPTPIKETKEPDNSILFNFIKDLSKINLRRKVICLESTIYPGLTEELFLPLFKRQGLKLGKDVFLGYSPERIDPSNKKYNIENVPKIVSGYTNKCLQRVNELYSKISKIEKASSIKLAEFVKCYENIFRSINISFANEMKVLSQKVNLDIFEIIKLANTKPFGIMPFYPGPGMGGHCIPVDPHILSWYAKKNNFYTRFIELSGQINDTMPNYVVKRLQDHALKNNIKGKKILLLGIAYKKNISDLRESPAIKTFHLLKKLNYEVFFHDPLINVNDIQNLKMKKSNLDTNDLKNYAYVICLADHDAFDYRLILKYSNFILDTRNRFNPKNKKVITA